MEAEEMMTYEKWYESQCHDGYDVDEDWLCQEITYLTNKIGISNGWGTAFDPYIFPPSSTKFKPHRNTLDYSIGHYLGDSNVVWECHIDLHELPPDSPVRAKYPMAMAAVDAGILRYTLIDIAHSARFPRAEHDWQFENHDDYLDEDPIDIGSVFDGMEWELFEELAQKECEALMDEAFAVYEEMSEQVTAALFADYEWFYSEERYREEIE